MTESAFLDRLRQRRDDLLRRIVDVLRRDERVRAAWLGGSFGRGTADGWSDLDLYSAIDDEHLACWLAERGDLLHRASEPLQIGPPGPGFTLAEGVFQSVLFAGPVQVDWEVAPASVAVRHPDTLVLLERESIPVRVPARLDEHECQSRIEGEMGFFWAMALIALK